MTVCIAAVCEGGRQAVCATDGLLSYSGIVADVLLAKMYFINEWLFMYAGEPSQAQMILEEIHWVLKESGEHLSRANIQQVTSKAYDRRMAARCSAPILRPLNFTSEEFKRSGLEKLGAAEFSRLTQEIEKQAQHFQEQLLVVGWGKAERACMIYEEGPFGNADHGMEGVAAIGSGAEMALSTMLLLGQSRESMLPETLYAVASAKFAAEKSHGQDVGFETSMYVCEKAVEGAPNPPGKMVQKDEIARLRKLWEEHGRPRIPDSIYGELATITNKIGYDAHISPKRLEAFMQSALEKSEDQP
jgi:ATP-dependent protease HslVU (ClpYQ) peptidase subunit